jgi:hypothetical protein
MEDMSKEELIAMFQKVRVQTMQIAADKKTAVDSLESCTREKDELRNKALLVIQRCKELEEKLSLLNDYKTKCESYVEKMAEQEQKLSLLETSRSNARSTEEPVDLSVLQGQTTSSLAEENVALQNLTKYLESELLKREEATQALRAECREKDLQISDLQKKVGSCVASAREVSTSSFLVHRASADRPLCIHTDGEVAH